MNQKKLHLGGGEGKDNGDRGGISCPAGKKTQNPREAGNQAGENIHRGNFPVEKDGGKPGTS